MNQKGFANIILIVLVVVLAGTIGYFVLRQKQEPVIQQAITPPSTATTLQPTAPTSADEIANWKTYRNEKYGFEVKYPPSFEVREEWKIYPGPRGDSLPTYVSFRSPSRESFQVGVFVTAAGTSLDKAVHLIQNIEGVLRIKNRVDFTVSGIPAQKISAEQISFSEMGDTITFSPPRPREEVFFVRGTQSYLIYIDCGTLSMDAFPNAKDFCINKQDQFLDKIVSTFKFTDDPLRFGLTGMVVPPKCMLAESPKSSGGQNEWLIDCGSRNNNARGTIGASLEQQGWMACGSGLATASWWKDGVITTVIEGDGISPFRITQRNGANCQ